ncbi:DUF3343 domain-containing protein [Syntrophomonas erecta]
MEKGLFKLDNFCVFTFATTSYALKAEKILKSLQADFMVIPTLREISSSCGLSVKLRPEHLAQYAYDLSSHNVVIEGVYEVEKVGHKNHVQKIDLH